MKAYIGSKIIQAEPAAAPAQIGDHPKGAAGYKVVYPDGYVSWSPKAVFEAAYREVSVSEAELVVGPPDGAPI